MYKRKRLSDFLRNAKVKMNAFQAILLLCCVVMQLLLGFCCQLNELLSFVKINCTVAGTFLQIQATLLTLSIALVAVISSLISDSYMGISYTDFLLNIRPTGYTQYTIIKISLAYIVIAAFSFWFKWYYLVACFLFCEILLIYISASSVYEIFKGKQYLQNEIKDYTQSVQLSQPQCYKKSFFGGQKDNETQYNTAHDVQDKFIGAFSEVLEQGSNFDYKEYVSVLCEITKTVWENRNDPATVYPLERFQRNISKIIHACSNSGNPNSALLALRLIDDVYIELINCIKKTCIKSLKGNTEKSEKDDFDVNITQNETDDFKYQFKFRETFELATCTLAACYLLVALILYRKVCIVQYWQRRHSVMMS